MNHPEPERSQPPSAEPTRNGTHQAPKPSPGEQDLIARVPDHRLREVAAQLLCERNLFMRSQFQLKLALMGAKNDLPAVFDRNMSHLGLRMTLGTQSSRLDTIFCDSTRYGFYQRAVRTLERLCKSLNIPTADLEAIINQGQQ
ncbi:hypothetical protein F66182_6203 [Fusarium sp. NRRL 66182]|nr:hypothetical protein F66182_6203 [Fusarium sp. NRRL 66182]